MKSPNIEMFREKRVEWIECLKGGDRNSIVNQIGRMLWNAAAFSVINEAVNLAKSKSGQVRLNAMTLELIRSCFFESQILAIRRLGDEYALEDSRGVYSLVALIHDMKKHSALLTRENLSRTELGERSDFNRIVDILAGVTEEAGSPCDIVRSEYFDFLERQLTESLSKIKDVANKHIAHPATPKSRRRIKQKVIELKQLLESCHVICKVANFLDAYFLTGATTDLFPTPQYNHLQYIENPLCTADQIPRLSDVWHGFHKEIRCDQAWSTSEIQSALSESAL